MPPGAAGYPPNSSYGGYPPPPHNRPDGGPYPGSGGGYPPSSYPPAQRPGWPPHQGYGPPPTNGGPPPPNNAPPPGADYRQGYYGPRPGGPGYPPGGPQSGPPQASAGASPATSTASSGGPPNAPGGPPPNQNLYGQQPPYHDQYQVCKNWKLTLVDHELLLYLWLWHFQSVCVVYHIFLHSLQTTFLYVKVRLFSICQSWVWVRHTDYFGENNPSIISSLEISNFISILMAESEANMYIYIFIFLFFFQMYILPLLKY